MSYFVICSFDLANCNYEDYQNAYNDLSTIGLRRDIVSSQGQTIRLPTTTAAGEFNGESTGQIRTDLLERISSAFHRRGFSHEVFLSVAGSDWAWGHRNS